MDLQSSSSSQEFLVATTIWTLASQVPSSGDGAVVDAAGRQIATMPAEFSGGDVEVARGDLADILYSRTAATCEYVFSPKNSRPEDRLIVCFLKLLFSKLSPQATYPPCCVSCNDYIQP